MTDQSAPTARVRVVLWPVPEGAEFPAGDLSLTDANAIELEQFARDYAGVPLLELMRRLRLAEWNADHYRQEAEQAQQSLRELPALHQIRELDARHRRIRQLLDAPGRVSRAQLETALREPTATVRSI